MKIKSAHEKSGQGITCVSSSSQSNPGAKHNIQSDLCTDLLTVRVANKHTINLLGCNISSCPEWMAEDDIT